MKGDSLRTGILLSVASTIVLILLIEGLASLLMSAWVAKRTVYMREESHSQYDAELGWSHRPGLRIESMYGDKTRFTTNAQGFRARENFAKGVPPGKHRVVALGDSFTMGYGVGDESTYPSQMQALCPVLQTVNMGQGGYGADQAYLWYKRDGVKLDANVLLFAVVAEDFYRMSGDSFIGYGKPVPFNQSRLRSALGVSVVALAGPAANLVLAALCAIPLRFGAAETFGAAYAEILSYVVVYNCVLAIFNLIPIPPLDGSNVVYGLLPPRQQWAWRSYQQYGPFLLLALLLFGYRFLSLLVFQPALAIARLLAPGIF